MNQLVNMCLVEFLPNTSIHDDIIVATSVALYQMVINIDFRSSEMPPVTNNGIFKSICWAFGDPLNRL